MSRFFWERTIPRHTVDAMPTQVLAQAIVSESSLALTHYIREKFPPNLTENADGETVASQELYVFTQEQLERLIQDKINELPIWTEPKEMR